MTYSQRMRYAEAAAYLACSERQLRRWTAAGRVPHTRLGLAVTFTAAQLDEFVAANTFDPEAPSRH